MIYELMGWLHANLARGLSRERGQGTVEYVGLVLLLALLLAGVVLAAKSAGGGAAIPKAIVGKIQEAIGAIKAK
jgi:hypothetical protein